MDRKVAITGMGAVTPVGNDVPSLWASLKAGASGAGPITRFDASAFDCRIACEVKGFDPLLWMDSKESRRSADFTRYAMAAAAQAVQDSGLAGAGYDPYRVGTWIGNGVGGIEIFEQSHAKLLASGPSRMLPMTVPLMISNEAPAAIAIRHGFKGPSIAIITACSSGSDAIGAAYEAVRSGLVDCAVCGGTEGAVSAFAVGGFCMLKALSTRNDDPERASRPFDKDRDGFVLGEGAGVIVIEALDAARARGARVYAELAGYGATCDAYHQTAPDPEGTAGAKAIALALERGGLKPSDVDYYNAHGTSTPINDPTETAMLKKAFGERATTMKISSTKSMTGHLLGAAGAVEAIICVKAIEEGFVPPTINLDAPGEGCDLDYVPKVGVKADVHVALSGSLGFGGHNGVLAFRRAE